MDAKPEDGYEAVAKQENFYVMDPSPVADDGRYSDYAPTKKASGDYEELEMAISSNLMYAARKAMKAEQKAEIKKTALAPPSFVPIPVQLEKQSLLKYSPVCMITTAFILLLLAVIVVLSIALFKKESDNRAKAIEKELQVEPDVIVWHGKYWAHACDFPGNDMSSVITKGDECGPRCAQTIDCTHFTWASENRTCVMKKGKVSKADAIVADGQLVCGFRTIEWLANYALGCNFKNNRTTGTAIVIASECGPACSKADGCTHFVWSDGICQLKSGTISRKDAVLDVSSTICGVV